MKHEDDPIARRKKDNVSFHMTNIIKCAAREAGVEDLGADMGRFFGRAVNIDLLTKTAALRYRDDLDARKKGVKQ